ncbi:hypothetical protein DL98DRAFT_317383 [Cadophora sp. DSE1049]|nr:hypothetical protein DL98DRAFT_317383 [Cadophora sp. DSE1049]
MAPQDTHLRYPHSEAAFKQRFPKYAELNPQDLGSTLLSQNGSRWTLCHLEAFHVILQPCPKDKDMPVLGDHMESAKATLSKLDTNLRKQLDLERSQDQSYSTMSHNELRVLGGAFGSFHVQLCDVLRLPEPPSERNAASIRESIRVINSTRASSQELDQYVGHLTSLP